MTQRLRLRPGQRGLSLVELLVALVMSLVVLIGLSSVYVAVKQSFRFQETTGRMVEDANFALDLLAKDIRMGGHAGCMGISAVTSGTTLYYPTSSLSNADPNPGGISGPNPLSVLEAGNPEVTAQPLMPKNFLRGYDAIPAAMFSTGSAPAAGSSSALFLAAASANAVALSAAMSTPASALTLASDPYNWRNTSSNSGIYDFVLSSCTTSSLFRGKVTQSGGAYSVAHDAVLGNASGNFTYNPVYPAGALLMPLEWKFFYIATRSGASTPSLYMVSYDGNNRQNAQELVANVEAMQIHYGENTVNNADGSASLQINVWRTSAAAVTDWSRVVALRVGLMMVSAESNANADGVQSVPTLLGQPYSPPSGALSTRLRREFSTTVLLRNRVAQ